MRRGSIDYARTTAVADIQQSFLSKRAIGFGDGIEVNSQLKRQRPDGRQWRTGRNARVNDEHAKLIDDLAIGRRGVFDVDADVVFIGHEYRVHVHCTLDACRMQPLLAGAARWIRCRPSMANQYIPDCNSSWRTIYLGVLSPKTTYGSIHI